MLTTGKAIPVSADCRAFVLGLAINVCESARSGKTPGSIRSPAPSQPLVSSVSQRENNSGRVAEIVLVVVAGERIVESSQEIVELSRAN